MDIQIILYFIVISYFSEALPFRKQDDDTYFTSSFEDEYEDILPVEENKNANANPIAKRPIHTYEVTENVIDIPDDRFRGPIHANFTIFRPLNIAPGNERIPNQKTREEGKRNCITLLDVKDELNDEKEKISSGDLDFDKVPEVHGIKAYFDGIKKGIVSGFKNIIHRNKHVEDFEPEDVGPVTFLDKIHKKSSNIAHKFRSTLGGKFDDIFGS